MTISNPNLIRGSKALAEALRVHPNTIWRWRKSGILKPATVVDCGRTIVYDLEITKECLSLQPKNKTLTNKKTDDMTNPRCLRCHEATSRLNGRWCDRLDRLVEYSPLPPCETQD